MAYKSAQVAGVQSMSGKPVQLPLPVLPKTLFSNNLASEGPGIVGHSKKLSEVEAALSQANAENNQLRSQLQVIYLHVVCVRSQRYTEVYLCRIIKVQGCHCNDVS